jgi:hypothetical protein
MKKEIKGFICGILITVIIMSTVTYAAGVQQKIDVMLNSVNLKVNGKIVNADNILYKGTTYVPLRVIGEMLGKEVGWDQKSNTASINDKGFIPVENDSKNASANSGKNIFVNLSEQDIQSAINEGKKGVMSISSFGNKNYGLNLVEGVDMLIDNAKISTPYLSIAESSALKSSAYQEISKEDINKLLTEYEYMIPFTVKMYGSSVDFPDYFHIVLKQGTKVIQPTAIYGKNIFADHSPKWPNYPGYQANFGAEFPTKEIDFSKKAELVVIWASELEFVFEVDFSKYK